MAAAGNPTLVVEVKIEPKSKRDTEQLLSALSNLAQQDPTFGYSQDPESGELVVASVSESQLEAQLETLKRVYGVQFLLGAPQVRYHETVKGVANFTYTHKRLLGGAGEFALVKLRIEPRERGAGNEFANEIIGGEVPEEFVAGVEKGVRCVWRSGLLIGFPMVDIAVTLYDGAYHEQDSSLAAFEIAGRMAMQEGGRAAGVKLLEPIMDVEVLTPGDFIGSILRDIDARRGQVRRQEMRGADAVVRADVPMDCLFGYASSFRVLAKGRGSFSMQFSHYADARRRDDGPDNFPPAVGMRA